MSKENREIDQILLILLGLILLGLIFAFVFLLGSARSPFLIKIMLALAIFAVGGFIGLYFPNKKIQCLEKKVEEKAKEEKKKEEEYKNDKENLNDKCTTIKERLNSETACLAQASWYAGVLKSNGETLSNAVRNFIEKIGSCTCLTE